MRESISARYISYRDVRKMIWDRIQRKCPVCRGGVNGAFGLT